MTQHGPAGWSNSYARLPEHFFARIAPTPVARPRLIQVNRVLADELAFDLGTLDDDSLAARFAGNVLLPGAEPIAMAYAGHQFGQFVPQLGDGRAILLGEVHDRAGVRRDIQLKGSGRTPYSRNGDGRAALGPVLREYLLSEAMHALGVPATRALAAVTTGEQVYRERKVPGAVLTRVAASHVRVGTFQYFAARADDAAIKCLADYVIARHYPAATEREQPYLTLLQGVIERQASLIAKWQQFGFIHGVMNTDNMAVSGETIDFGPCAFLDAYGPDVVFSSIDHAGRYAYGNQPYAAQWNLARFAETLLPLLDPQPEQALELANEAIAAFLPRFTEHWLAGMRRKLGLFSAADGDLQLIQSLLDAMQANQADFTLTFRRLCDAVKNTAGDAQLRMLFANPDDWDAWAVSWKSRLTREPHTPTVRVAAMQQANPGFIPRNHRVEQVINAAVERDDYSLFAELLHVLSRPFEEQAAFAGYSTPPLAGERVLQTFCGT
jgi:serine/tyrosine/threonine adenylyltransferase